MRSCVSRWGHVWCDGVCFGCLTKMGLATAASNWYQRTGILIQMIGIYSSMFCCDHIVCVVTFRWTWMP